jgi:hypothetical protein
MLIPEESYHTDTWSVAIAAHDIQAAGSFCFVIPSEEQSASRSSDASKPVTEHRGFGSGKETRKNNNYTL